jgi:2'-5' RNA ligase
MSVNIRSFLAVDLDDEDVRRKLVSAQEVLSRTGADLKLVERENIHVTLRFLGNTPKGDIDKIVTELSNVKFKPFRAEIRGVGVFPGLSRPRVVWAGFIKGEKELEDLFQRIEPRLRGLGVGPDNNPFHPHLTLARVGSGKNRDRLVQQIMALSDEPFGEIQVDSFQLKKSTLTPRGPLYETLHSFKAEEI